MAAVRQTGLQQRCRNSPGNSPGAIREEVRGCADCSTWLRTSLLAAECDTSRLQSLPRTAAVDHRTHRRRRPQQQKGLMGQ
mmetsp:Transcript_18538/g.41454  ORF Transcript_18538/g.41454 Transcript_18538/m.41454 type:complete len:81 (+) Transcript_18538:145-387(+)